MHMEPEALRSAVFLSYQHIDMLAVAVIDEGLN